jgi:hypothetical protein
LSAKRTSSALLHLEAIGMVRTTMTLVCRNYSLHKSLRFFQALSTLDRLSTRSFTRGRATSRYSHHSAIQQRQIHLIRTRIGWAGARSSTRSSQRRQ